MITLWKGEFSRFMKCSVEVFSEKTGSVVASNDSIRIYHRDDKGNEIFSKLFCAGLFTTNVLQESFADKRAVGLPGVDSSSKYEDFFVVVFRLLVGDFEDGNR